LPLFSFTAVHIWSVSDGKSHRVTPPFFNAQSPAWAPNGEVLYFLSQRDYQPLLSTVEFDFATDRQTGIFAVTLRKGVKNPFDLRDDEPGSGRKTADKNSKAPPFAPARNQAKEFIARTKTARRFFNNSL